MAEFGFSKARRLVNAADFNRVFRKTRWRASSRTMLVLATASDHSAGRIGFVIARKNVASAVHRNRIKRVIREYYRTHPDLAPTADLVVVARRGIDKMSNDQLCETFSLLCGRIRDQA